MPRIVAVVAFTAWLAANSAFAEEPTRLLVVAEDPRVAAMLPPLPEHVTLAVLIESRDEAFDAIDARALKMRHAHFFVYLSDLESTVSAIFRERLQNHGAVAIDLRTVLRTSRCGRVPVDRPVLPSFANYPKKR